MLKSSKSKQKVLQLQKINIAESNLQQEARINLQMQQSWEQKAKTIRAKDHLSKKRILIEDHFLQVYTNHIYLIDKNLIKIISYLIPMNLPKSSKIFKSMIKQIPNQKFRLYKNLRLKKMC